MSSCICCGNNNWRLAYKLPKFLFDCKSDIYVCNECGLGRTSPEPSGSIEYYEENSKYDSLFTGKEELYKKFARSLLALLGSDNITKKRTLLDIGCGGGFLVDAATQMGYMASGIEANVGMVSWAVDRGLPVRQGDIQQMISGHEKYDVVVLSAVLEHVRDPSSLLLDSHKLLKPDGKVLISQASYDGLLPRFFPWGWYGWQPKEHFWHFTPKSFGRLAKSCGLKVMFYQRNSLYHSFYFSGGFKNLLARNFATLLARIGNKIGYGDNFDCIVINDVNNSETSKKND